MQKSIDPRVIRTRRLLMNALTELIVEEGVNAVTIREIVRKAEVNRSTFYLHFFDKQDILTQMQDEILNELAESLKFPAFTYEAALHDYQNSKIPIKSLVSLIQHIQKHASLYQTMLNERDFRERFTEVIRTEAFRLQNSFWEAAFVSNGAVGVILYWLESGMKESIMEMSLWLTRVSLVPLGKFA
ncbi:TetR/AcrR family transcriptional regulator [Paenibacillus dakarensis]|uniref:TetR/AcrR family transcriptional regulator n=1 Tax=Paenibacillus dakarensis TaxID=1527293 RepID=UPI0006D52D7D|nr:TetR/AcrR family transcriptional regulator [Paenibacillus dakarensis]